MLWLLLFALVKLGFYLLSFFTFKDSCHSRMPSGFLNRILLPSFVKCRHMVRYPLLSNKSTEVIWKKKIYFRKKAKNSMRKWVCHGRSASKYKTFGWTKLASKDTTRKIRKPEFIYICGSKNGFSSSAVKTGEVWGNESRKQKALCMSC